jgi:hypothetical protein
VIDERDQAALADQEGDDESEFNSGITIEHVKVTRRVFAIFLRQAVRMLNQLLGSIAHRGQLSRRRGQSRFMYNCYFII